MQPVIRHSFLRNAKPKVSASFQECGDSGTWTILKSMSLKMAIFRDECTVSSRMFLNVSCMFKTKT